MTSEIVANGFKMQYLRFGTGAKTLVILPGLSVQSVIPAAAAIEKQYEILCNDFTVYLFDRRGNLPENYSVADMARDTAAAIKALGLSDVCLFGVSQGGMIALQIAADYPETVGKLALGSTACRVDEKAACAINDWIALAESGDAESLYLSFGKAVYPEAVFEQFCATFAEMAKTVTQQDLKRFIILAKGMAGFDISGRLSEIKCSVLAVGDTEDRVLGADATPEIAKRFSGNADFETYIYSGYGHAVYDTAPDFPQRLYKFFK